MKKLTAAILVLMLLLSACGNGAVISTPGTMETPQTQSEAPEPSADELAQVIMIDNGFELDRMQLINDNYDADMIPGYVEGFYGLASEVWSDCAIYRSVAADEAYEVSVFKLTEQAELSSVFNELEEYRHSRQGDFFGYNPEQAEMVDKGIVSISSDGVWAAVLICTDPARAEEAFYARLSLTLPEDEEDNEPASTATDVPEGGEVYLEGLGELPDYWLPYTDPNIDDMTLWDNSTLVAALKAGSDEGLDAYGRKLYKKADKVIKKVIDEGMSAIEKEEAIYEWLTANCEYDFRHYEVPNNAPRESYEPYGAIVEGTAVCLGFATAFQLFMDVLDIECITVVGAAFNSMEDHAWNMVKIDGEWYCVDATWDAGTYGFGYFNVSSDYMAMTGHQWDYAAYPIAVAEGDGEWADVIWVPVE